MVHYQYWFSNLSACVENLFFAGIIFGWPSLQYVLENEGYFSYLCTSTNASVIDGNSSEVMTSPIRCKEQQASFNLIFTITLAFIYGMAFPFGYMLDRFGTWVFRSMLSLMYTLGIVLLTVSSASLSVLLYPAIVLLGVSGLGLMLSNFQLANFAQSYRGLVITLLNGLRGSSVLVFLLVKKGYDSGTDLRLILEILCWITIYQVIRTFVLMPRKLIPFPLKESTLEYGYKEWICFKTRQVAEHFVPVSLFVVGSSKKVTDKVVELRKNRGRQKVSFLSCLKKPLFWTNVFHLSVISFRVNFVFGTLQPWLRSFVEPSDISRLTDIFGIMLLLCGLTAPMNGMLFDFLVRRFKLKVKNSKIVTLKACLVSMTTTTTLATLLSIMMATFNPYGVFVLQLFARSFVYGGSVTFISANFPAQHIGKLFGLTNFIAGVTSLIQYALFQVALAVDPNFYFINVGLTLVVVLTLVHPALIYYNIHKKSIQEEDDFELDKGMKSAFQFTNLFGVGMLADADNKENLKDTSLQ